MASSTILETLKGLVVTAQELINVLGIEDAREDLKQLESTYNSLIDFWEVEAGNFKDNLVY